MRIFAVAFVFVIFAPLVAQDGGQDDDRWTRWMVSRLQRNLDLDDEQVGKVTEIMKETAKKQDDKIREILTDEQKENFKGLRAALSNWGGGNRNRNRSRSRSPGFLRTLSPDRLKRELDLDDAQVDKIEPLVNEVNEEYRKRMEELREEGYRGVNWTEEMAKWRERAKETAEKIKEHLTEEQKTKLDKLLAGESSRNERGRRRGGRSIEDRVKRVIDRLGIENEEEAAAIGALIQAVLEAMDKQREVGRESSTKVRNMTRKDDAEEGDIEILLEEVRAGRAETRKALREARKPLREVVSYKQELRLVELGVLE